MAAVQLAHLAAEKKQASTMRFVTFNDSLVSEVEHTLQAWQYETPMDACEDSEGVQRDLDRMHYCETWRHGLLVYVFRVFHWFPSMPVQPVAIYHARVVTDHVFSCRFVGYLAKQALLPLFWACCEIMEMRDKISEFCTYWSTKTRYRLLDDTLPLLDEIWSEQERLGANNTCWTAIVDRWHARERDQDSIPRTICFG